MLRTTLLHGLMESARRNVDAGDEGIALFEIAASSSRVGSRLPRARARRGDRRRWVLRREGRRGGSVRGDQAPSLASSARASRSCTRARLRARRPAGSANCIRLLGAHWLAGSNSTWSRCSPPPPSASQYEDVITYPPLKQDLAFVVDEDVAAGGCRGRDPRAVEEVREARVFDVYRGEPDPEGRKSVAIAVSFPGARPHALRRGGCRDARADRRRPARAVQGRAEEPEGR